jgi:DNA-binding transcriptional regulator LsrR (DeoR family)
MAKNNALLVRIASLYFEHGVNQNEIAEICGIERSRVSRLLLQARNLGIVQFHVVDPTHKNEELSYKLQEKYLLQNAIVFNTLSIPENQLKKTIGLMAADYIVSIVKERDVFAISWGESVLHTIQGLEIEEPRNLTVVPAIGGSDLISPAYHINEMVRLFVNKVGGIRRTLYAPAFVESKQMRDSILNLKDIKTVTDLWKDVTLALVGIGKSPFTYRLRKGVEMQFGQFYLEDFEQHELLEMGVMGDINSRFFDVNGEEIPASIHDRIIGMNLEQLHKVPLVIGVAGGAGKVDAIRAALLGGVLNVLITDSETAGQILSGVHKKN